MALSGQATSCPHESELEVLPKPHPCFSLILRILSPFFSEPAFAVLSHPPMNTSLQSQPLTLGKVFFSISKCFPQLGERSSPCICESQRQKTKGRSEYHPPAITHPLLPKPSPAGGVEMDLFSPLQFEGYQDGREVGSSRWNAISGPHVRANYSLFNHITYAGFSLLTSKRSEE